MEKVKTVTNEIENLVALLLVQKEKLEEREEVDPSKGFVSKTLLAIKQFNKKMDTILSNREPKVSEELEMEICENE
jgi:hypothetical protein